MQSDQSKKDIHQLSKKRLSGILVHPTSFPSPYGIGDLGSSAREFIDFLCKAGQHLWQVLPLGPTGFGNSPYQSYSAFAGQPLLISPDDLISDGLLDKEEIGSIPRWKTDNKIEFENVIPYKKQILKSAYNHFKLFNDNDDLIHSYNKFLSDNLWLSSYALFMAVKAYHKDLSWQKWATDIAHPTEKSKKKWTEQLSDEVNYYKFIQFIFFKQWNSLKKYANDRDIAIIGDIPIFVSEDSCDVWSHPELFQLDESGYPLSVAGVPPDYFSRTGQRWGNPLYYWENHKKDNYSWWISRIKNQLNITDYLRIDHFRGFESYWSIPANENTAINGEWKKGPGASLFNAITKELGNELPIIAEDLGIITPEVEALRDQFGFPGMKVLQFAFDDVKDNAFLPYNYTSNCICYSGTHDNDTTNGWYQHASEQSKDKVRRYMSCDGNNVSWNFISTALSSVARIAIVPLQDVLHLGSEARMNYPGSIDNNWVWRYSLSQLSDTDAKNLYNITKLYGR